MKNLILILILTLVGCGSTKNKGVLNQNQSAQKSVEITSEIDTTIRVTGDTSVYVGNLAFTDSATFILTPVFNNETESLEAPEVKLENNQIKVNCYKKAQDLFLKWKIKYLETHKSDTTTEYVTVEKEKGLTESQKFWIFWIRLLVLAFVTLLTIHFIKQKSKNNG